MSEPDTLTLKWRSLKAWDINSEAGMAALNKFFEDPVSMSAALQENTDRQADALCELIDAVQASGGEIWNDWDGTKMTPDEAKKYVRGPND